MDHFCSRPACFKSLQSVSISTCELTDLVNVGERAVLESAAGVSSWKAAGGAALELIQFDFNLFVSKTVMYRIQTNTVPS